MRIKVSDKVEYVVIKGETQEGVTGFLVYEFSDGLGVGNYHVYILDADRLSEADLEQKIRRGVNAKKRPTYAVTY